MQSEPGQSQESIAQRSAESADVARIADTAVSTWRDIAAALSPIFGHRGVAALFKRSVYLMRADYPWLAAAYGDGSQAGDFGALQTALLQQTGAQAAAAHGALQQTFYDLLARLIGASLTERLLRSVLDNPLSGHAAQDRSS